MDIETKLLTFQFGGVSFDFRIGSSEKIISQNVENTGVWEENQLSLYKDLIGDAGVFVDIGANVGINSLYAKHSLPNARVVAVEPEPRNHSLLVRNTENTSIEVLNLAIADKNGSVGFAGTGTNAHINMDAQESTRVTCVTLDDLVQSLGVSRVNLMKIDVEGFTDLVLSKSSSALSHTDNVIIEFSHGDIVSRIESQDQQAVLDHSEILFDFIRPHFTHFYYISRRDGLVALADTKDLFDIMFSEAVVGDILATRRAVTSISSTAFAFRSILELKRQNHLRMMDIQKLGK